MNRKSTKLQLQGQKFGDLEVLHELRINRRKNLVWLVRCLCGVEFEITSHGLTRGTTARCNSCRLKRLQFNNRKADSAVRHLFSRYRCQARTARRSFKISFEKFKTLTSAPCFYTGRVPEQIVKMVGSQHEYNGLDRLNNRKGYTLQNSVPCCGVINKMKGTLDAKTFILLCKEVAKHHG